MIRTHVGGTEFTICPTDKEEEVERAQVIYTPGATIALPSSLKIRRQILTKIRLFDRATLLRRLRPNIV